jgi:hypothetical protein
MNEVLPGPIDQGGRMEVEKKQYAIDGYIAFFKHEDDGDYHVVLTDTKDAAVQGGQGGSMVVELPDPDCFGGHSGKGPQTSQLGQQLAEAKADFEKATSGLNGAKLTPAQRPHVRVTGVAFFDFDHGQTGRSKPHPMPDANGQPMLKQQKVIELHPITQITFLDQVEPD